MKVKNTKSLIRASQWDTVDLIIENPYFAIFNDMGFGKTIVSLTAIDELISSGEIEKALVVSTLLVSRETWPPEVQDWEHTIGLSVKFIRGKNAKERSALFEGNEKVHTINQENFVWLVENFKDKWPYDMVVFDDAKGLKNAKVYNRPKSPICVKAKDCAIYQNEKTYLCKKSENCKDFKMERYGEGCAVKCEDFEPIPNRIKTCSILCREFESRLPRLSIFGALRTIRPKLKRLIHLTGTPSSKELLDIWPMFATLDNGERLGRTYSKFKSDFFNKGYSGFGFQLKKGSKEKIFELIKDMCVTIESEAELPILHNIKMPIKIGLVAEKLYRSFEKEYIIAIEEESIEAKNSGVLSGKLLQICGGAVYTGNQKEWVTLHDSKIEALKDIIEKHKGEPILVGYNFGHELERLKKAFPQGVDIRDLKDPVESWNQNKVSLMFAHPASAGHGLNLQKGKGRTLVWFGLNWALDLDRQLNKRIYRPGQKRETFIYYLVAEGLADTRVMENVAKKGATQDDLKRAVLRDCKKRKTEKV